MLLRKLFRTVGIYKSQFISMIIMIGIGIGVFLGFNIEWHSIKTNTTSFFQKTNYADFRLYSDAGFSAEDIAKVKKIEGVKAATRYFSVNVGIKDKKQTVTLNVSEDYNVSTMLITSGEKYAETSEGVWISDKFADENNIDIGDEIIFEYQGAEIRCEVIGFAKSGENMICVADSNQIMPDFSAHGFAYITPSKLESCFGTAFYP